MKLIIGNKNYSSWSLRGWLACKQSGIAFEEITVPLYGEEWDKQKTGEEFAPSHGKVPILWDGETVIWDSMAIIDWLADKTHRDRFWPKDETARGMARSMAAEMHSSFMALRQELPMNIRQRLDDKAISAECQADVMRVLSLWAEARARFGKQGPFLFGTFGAADIMYAPVITRFRTYGFTLPGFAEAYSEAILEHDWMQQWCAAAVTEDWSIERFDALAT
ncbi:glutathione S-transferase family protein [Alterisphingorhabdus coralli]|uniref:Glutathione S-transferase family protein n=1 Tax=Alterisphingorhabdus coralli TaxID=3071408 RepID=A0AA97F618_9SPHN|nr:glutathione S-transferase family protein [Parasphingorhabdus sp. SCSIO 66989]WOE75044.1 glutathione S-transferase family protein [Parasphingorhabdus sp. SCSIO 66989]